MRPVKVPPYLHNLLNCLRVALAPALVGAAYWNAKIGFAVLLGLALAAGIFGDSVHGDAQAENALSRQLGVWADRLLVGAAAIGFGLLWPEVIGREWVWITVALAGYVAAGIGSGRGDRLEVKLWIGDVLGSLVPLSLLLLVATDAAGPFHVAAIVQAVAGMGQLLLPAMTRPNANS